jgi:hypothetical protein
VVSLLWYGDSTTNDYKADNSQKSFVFTVKNSRNSEPRKFKLSNALNAIYSHSGYGPTFGSGYGLDIYVADSCNTNASGYTNLGYGYVNDTGISGTTVFTGERTFTVKEIEVFTITL